MQVSINPEPAVVSEWVFGGYDDEGESFHVQRTYYGVSAHECIPGPDREEFAGRLQGYEFSMIADTEEEAMGILRDAEADPSLVVDCWSRRVPYGSALKLIVTMNPLPRGRWHRKELKSNGTQTPIQR